MAAVSVIDGDRTLPSGFDHPHASEEARAIAEAGLILRVQVGSGVHGTSINGQDDRDEMGICLEPARFVLVAVHGYDTKFAVHALRLGVRGVELLTSGRITLPVPEPEPERGHLRAIRRGEVAEAEVVAAIDGAEQQLLDLRQDPVLPDQPDRTWVDS